LEDTPNPNYTILFNLYKRLDEVSYYSPILYLQLVGKELEPSEGLSMTS
jgi:hypothetical protein